MVEVVEIVTEVSGYLHFGPPKTRAGYRRVGLPRVVVEALAEHLGHPGSADDLVFMGPQGGTLRLDGHLYPDADQALRDRLDALHALSQARRPAHSDGPETDQAGGSQPEGASPPPPHRL